MPMNLILFGNWHSWTILYRGGGLHLACFQKKHWYDDIMNDDGEISVESSRATEAKAPIQRRKLSHEVLDRLLVRLRAGEFPVGAYLPSERDLMQMFSVGRPAVREALQALERMGFVAIVHGEGARVQALSADTLMAQISDAAMHLLSNSQLLLEHLKEARLSFEVLMVRQAAAKASPEDIAVLRSAIAEQRASIDDPVRFLKADMAFHRTIAAISRNTVFMAVSRTTLEWLEHFHRDAVTDPGAERGVIAEHEQVLERIAAHDPDGAATAITNHLNRANDRYRLNA